MTCKQQKAKAFRWSGMKARYCTSLGPKSVCGSICFQQDSHDERHFQSVLRLQGERLLPGQRDRHHFVLHLLHRVHHARHLTRRVTLLFLRGSSGGGRVAEWLRSLARTANAVMYGVRVSPTAAPLPPPVTAGILVGVLWYLP